MPSSKGSADYGGTDSGDTAFIIICGTLVLLMALPGIVLFYGRWPPPSPFLLACGWPRDGGRTLGSDVAAAPRAALRARTQTGRALAILRTCVLRSKLVYVQVVSPASRNARPPAFKPLPLPA
jgi:hypothetical protein